MKSHPQHQKRINFRGRLPGAVSRAAKSVQEINILNSGVSAFNQILEDKGAETRLDSTMQTRSLLSDILTGSRKVDIKIKGEVFTEDMDGREVLFAQGTELRENLADIDREQKEFEVPSAKGSIVDHDARYFEKVMITRADAVEHAILTRALKKAEENTGLIVTYFPEYRSEKSLGKIQHFVETEARENPKDYPSLRVSVSEIGETYKLTGELLEKVCPAEKLGEAQKKLEEKRIEEVRSLLNGMIGEVSKSWRVVYV